MLIKKCLQSFPCSLTTRTIYTCLQQFKTRSDCLVSRHTLIFIISCSIYRLVHLLDKGTEGKTKHGFVVKAIPLGMIVSQTCEDNCIKVTYIKQSYYKTNMSTTYIIWLPSFPIQIKGYEALHSKIFFHHELRTIYKLLWKDDQDKKTI